MKTIYEFSFSKKVYLMLVLSIALLITFSPTVSGKISAAQFFEESDVRVNYDEGIFVLKLDTPMPVLCAVNYGSPGEEFTDLTAMEMVSPARDHDIELGLKKGKRYKVILTAFTRDHRVFRSKTYLISTGTVPENKNLIDDTIGEARVLQPEQNLEEFKTTPEITDIGSELAQLSFATKKITLASTAIGETNEFGRLIRSSSTSPFRQRELDVLGLTPETKYFTETILLDRKGNLYRSERENFTTLEPKKKEDYGKNWASLEAGATIKEVSSNWGGDPSGTFGAKNAIDGDPGTEWSSQDEGNNAWIEIELPERIKITAIGFWTRTMGSTGQISKIRVTTGEGKVIGDFPIPSATELHDYSVTPTSADQIRFEVLESSGGNTGAREIKVYGTKIE